MILPLHAEVFYASFTANHFRGILSPVKAVKQYVKRSLQFVKRHAWVGAIIVFLVGTVFSSANLLMQRRSADIQRQSAEIEQLKAGKEIREKLQSLQEQAYALTIKAIEVRDDTNSSRQKKETEHAAIEDRLDMITQHYDWLETRLAKHEGRQPQPFKLRKIPPFPSPPQNLRVVASQ